MNSKEIYIGDKLVDLPSESLRLALKKQIDDFESMGGTVGTQINSTLNGLVLPGTKRNSDIFQNAFAAESANNDSKECLSFFALSGGLVQAKGGAVLRNPTKESLYPRQYDVAILGDAFAPVSELSGVNLCDLDLGTYFHEDLIFFENNAEPDGIIPFNVAPIIYGSEMQTAFDYTHLRPHIYYTHILKGIANYLGYRIESDVIQTDIFRRACEIFCVGADWRRADNWEDLTVTAELNSINSLSVLRRPIQIPTVLDDPLGDWFTATDTVAPFGSVTYSYYQPNRNGCYKVQFRIETNSPELIISYNGSGLNGTPSLPGNQQRFFPTDGVIEGCIEVELENAGQIAFYLEQVPNSPAANTVYGPVEINIAATQEAKPDMEIDLASCLPCKPVKEWLAAMMHEFGLVMHFDNMKRIWSIEPRFHYSYLDIATGTTERRQGWYRYPDASPGTEIQNYNEILDSREINQPIESPFGDDLTVGFKTDSKDGIEKYLLSKRADEARPIRGYNFEFLDRCEDSKTAANPCHSQLYYLNLSNYGYALPAILDKFEPFEGLPEASYKSSPKAAFYYGPATNLQFEFDGNLYPLPMLGSAIPESWLSELGAGGSKANSAPQFSYSSTDQNPGLGEIFHLQHLHIIRQAETFEGNFNYFRRGFYQENFRRLRRLFHSLYVQVETSDYTPFEATLTKARFWKYRSLKVGDIDQMAMEQGPVEVSPTGDKVFEYCSFVLYDGTLFKGTSANTNTFYWELTSANVDGVEYLPPGGYRTYFYQGGAFVSTSLATPCLSASNFPSYQAAVNFFAGIGIADMQFSSGCISSLPPFQFYGSSIRVGYCKGSNFRIAWTGYLEDSAGNVQVLTHEITNAGSFTNGTLIDAPQNCV